MADAAITFARRSRFQRRLSQRNLAVSPLFLLRNSWSRFHGRTSQGIAQGRNTREQAHIHGEKNFGSEKVLGKIRNAEALVAARHAGKRCARSQARRLHADRSEEDRCFPPTLGGAQLSPQKRRLPLRAFNADIL